MDDLKKASRDFDVLKHHAAESMKAYEELVVEDLKELCRCIKSYEWCSIGSQDS